VICHSCETGGQSGDVWTPHKVKGALVKVGAKRQLKLWKGFGRYRFLPFWSTERYGSTEGPECPFQGAVGHMHPYRQEGLHAVAFSMDLRLLIDALGDHLVDHRFYKSRGDRQPRPVTRTL
jgi:hypothetical protein